MNTRPTNDIFNAVFKEDFPEVKVFVEIRNASVNCLNDDAETPAHIAAYKGNLPILKYLVNVDERVLKVTDGWGQTVLHVATEKGPLEMVKFLVEDHKMDIYKRNKFFSGNTPIHIAALRGSLDLLKYFIEDKKVDPNLLNDLGQPPVFLAAQNAHILAVKYLYEDQNADVHVIDKENKTILHMCALTADLKVPKYLMDEKKLTFDINCQDNLGFTVVFWASRRKRMDFLKYFIEEKHADINIQNNDGWTPFHQAVNVHNTELIKYLYEHGANIQLKNKEGRTATNMTEDPELRDLIDKLTQTTRNRRSLSPKFGIIFNQRVRLSLQKLSFPSRALEEYVGGAPAMNGLQLNSLLLLADACFRYSTGLGYRRVFNQLLSPREIVHKKMDPLAIEAVTYDIVN